MKKLFVIIFSSLFFIGAWNTHQELNTSEYIVKAQKGDLVGIDNVSLGDKKGKLIETYGEPKKEGFWNGGPYIAYDNVMVIYNENDEITVLSTLGFGQTFSDIERNLGIADRKYYSEYETSYMLEYDIGEYVLEFFGGQNLDERDNVSMVWLRKQWQ